MKSEPRPSDGAAEDAAATTPGTGRVPLRVGLTGNIGSGKSSAARLLAERGALVIDADVLAREATHDPEVLALIAAELGDEHVLDEPGGGRRLDRAATARLVFEDAAALSRLNAIVHPWVARRRAELEEAAAASAEPPSVIVHDIPLLYENGLEAGLDLVVVVYAPLSERVRRVALRSGLDDDEVIRRDRSQLPLEEKVARADWVIDNSHDLPALEREVARLWEELTFRHRATASGS